MNTSSGFSFTEKLSVLAIVSILVAAGVSHLVDIITASQAAACDIQAKTIERAEQYYYFASGQHTYAYNNLTQISAACQLVNYGFLDQDLFSDPNCRYYWRVNAAGERFVFCPSCPSSPDSDQLLEHHINKHSSRMKLSKAELGAQLLTEYRFLESYLKEYDNPDMFLYRLISEVQEKYQLLP